MRRWLTGSRRLAGLHRRSTIVALVGIVALAGGCARPGGVDGDLLDDWPTMAAPAPYVPEPGRCYVNEFAPTSSLSTDRPVDCAKPHRLETVHVGTFTGAAADLQKPPRAGSGEITTAYADCDAKAREYVGDEWRNGRLRLGVALPTASAWTGGARWYRCDVEELSWAKGEPVPTNRTGSVKGALATADSPLRLGCFDVKLARTGKVDTMHPVDCGKPHNSEFVGVWDARKHGYPEKDRDWLPFYDGCLKRVAAYVGVPEDRNLRARTGVVTVPARSDDWQSGDRQVRCYLWVDGGRFTRSLKGVGPAGLPVPTG